MAKRGHGEGAHKRSEIVTVRFDPHLKYLAELAARKHRRPLSSFIEWCVEQAVSSVVIEQDHDKKDVTVAEADKTLHLWDSDEPERLVRLAVKFPDLLTHEEQILWRLLCGSEYFWKGRHYGDPPAWGWAADLHSVEWERVRQHWGLLREVAAGDKPRSDLPKQPEPPPKKS